MPNAVQRRTPDPVAPPNGTNGHTNGTNGHTNGTNGHNGHTNGTNGHTNGTNGHTNGTNGHTNGHTNGTNGHTNGTNGTRAIATTTVLGRVTTTTAEAGLDDLEQLRLAETELLEVRPDPINRNLSPRALCRMVVVADAIAIALAASISFALLLVFRPVGEATVRPHLVLFVATFPIWLGCFAVNKLYLARAVERTAEELRRIWASCAIATIGIVAIAFAFQYQALSRFWVGTLLVSAGLVVSVERAAVRRTFRKLRRTGRISRRVAIIGTDTHAIHLIHTLQQAPELGYDVVGFIGDDDVGTRGGCTRIGTVGDAERVLDEHGCVGAMISLASISADEVNRLTRQLTDHGYHVALSSSLRDIAVTRIRPQSIDGRTLLYVEPTIRDGWRAHAKRAFDVAVSIVGIVLTAPVMLITALLVKTTSPGPVFFRQERVGLDGRTFRMIKFRTMVADAERRRAELLDQNESDGPLFKIADDPRITTVGRRLRKWSIDELPQFFNVLRGDMSVVGPRPALPSEVEEWDPEVRERLRVLPGITGLWQVAGRSDASFDAYKRLDLFYVDNWSLLHDVRIVLRTFSAVLLSRGAR